jgi:hypothetical protein
MTPSDKDFAEFAQLGVRLGLLKPIQVQGWADNVILERDVPPDWAIELCTANPPEMIGVLNTVPGQISGGMPVNLLVGLIRQLWRNGELSIPEVRKLGWRLHSEGRLEKPKGVGDWGAVLECECEELDEGYRTEAEIGASIEEQLTPYAAFEPFLSAWSRPSYV